MSQTTSEFEAIKVSALARLPGVDPSLIDMEMQWALQEFLSETRLWTRVVPVTLIEGVREYTLGLNPARESPVVLLECKVGENRLRHGIDWLASNTDRGYPTMAGLDMIGPDNASVVVSPFPSAAETGLVVNARVAVTLLPVSPPDLDAMPLEARPYHSHLLDGLLARLFAMADKPWTNSRAADTHMRRFRQGIVAVRRELDAARTYGSLQVRMRRFGA